MERSLDRNYGTPIRKFSPDQPRDPHTGQWVRIFTHGILKSPSTMSYFSEGARNLGPAVLEDWRSRDVTPADIEESPGERVEGVLWDVPAEDMPRLDNLEGVASGHYEKVEVPVLHGTGRTSTATVYRMPRSTRIEERRR